MNKRQKKKMTDTIRSLVAQVDTLYPDGWHTDIYPEAIRLDGRRFRRYWCYAISRGIFRTLFIDELVLAHSNPFKPDRHYGFCLMQEAYSNRPVARWRSCEGRG